MENYNNTRKLSTWQKAWCIIMIVLCIIAMLGSIVSLGMAEIVPSFVIDLGGLPAVWLSIVTLVLGVAEMICFILLLSKRSKNAFVAIWMLWGAELILDIISGVYSTLIEMAVYMIVQAITFRNAKEVLE